MSWTTDLRYAFRSLWRRPGMTLTSVLSLAVGLGGTLAIYSVAHGVLFRPLPFAAPDRLVLVQAMVQRQTLEPRGFSVPDFVDYRSGTAEVFDVLAAGDTFTMTMRSDGMGAPTPSEMVTGDYFGLLGVAPIVGTVFPVRDAADATPPIVIGERVWDRYFNRDPGVLGRTIYGDDQAFIVTGVMPASFGGVNGTAQAWVPFATHPALVSTNTWNNRGSRWHGAFGRLKPGVTVEQANAALGAVGLRLAEGFPASNTAYTARAQLLRDALYGDVRPQLVILLAAVAVVLFMTCVNVANLLVARLSARQYEFSVRASLGATHGRIVSLAAADGCALAVMGAVAGVPLVWWLVVLLRQLDPAGLPAFAAPEISAPVVLAGLVLTAMAAAFITAASIATLQSGRSMMTSARGASDSTRTVRLRQGLTTVQMACAVALLTTAVLLGMSFRNLSRIEPGYRTDHTFVANIDLPSTRYDALRRVAVTHDLHTRLQSLPGVRAASVSADAMLGGGSSASFFTADVQASEPVQREGRTYVHSISDNFFSVAGIPILEGTTVPVFDGREIPVSAADMPVVVSQRLAQRFWPASSAIGQRIKLGRSDSTRQWMRIVGVAGDTKFRGLPDNPTQDPDLYMPFASRQTSSVWLVLHTSVDPGSIANVVQQAVSAVDPLVPLSTTYVLADRVAASTAPQRFLSDLSTTFGAVALLLAIVGTYGVVTYQVTLSQRAIGIRLALGAMPRRIFTGVMATTMRLAGIGLVAGVLLAVWAARSVADQLYEVTGADAWVIALASLIVSIVALASAWLPARRAMRVNPISVLRPE